MHYETLDGEKHTEDFDFTMLIPAFAGVDLKAFDNMDADITDKLFDASGFMKVDANYEDWHRFPEWGRNINYTVGESGLARHWIKLVLHHLFLYKAKGRFLRWMIPE